MDGIAQADQDQDGGQRWPSRRPTMSKAGVNTRHHSGQWPPHEWRVVAPCTADREQDDGR